MKNHVHLFSVIYQKQLKFIRHYFLSEVGKKVNPENGITWIEQYKVQWLKIWEKWKFTL